MKEFRVWFVGSDDVHLRIPLLLALRERGFRVGVAGSGEGSEFLQHDIPFWRYPLNRWISPLQDGRTRQALGRLLSEHRPDVVHVFDTKPGILVPEIARRAGIPGRVRTITGMGYVFSSRSPLALGLRPVYRHLQRRASRASGLTVFQNEEDREYFLRHRMVREGGDSLVRGSGIDLDQLRAERPDGASLDALRRELGLAGKIVVTMVSRLVVTKGVREYLKAAGEVRLRRDDVQFILVGPHASEGRQALPVREVERSARDVRYLGARSDVPAILAISDLFVLPTYYREGVPRVLLEAGATGLPLVASDMPGCRDVVRDGWNGLLVPPRDARSLASAILRVLESKEEMARMGGRSRAHVQDHFSLTRVADAYGELYGRVLAASAVH